MVWRGRTYQVEKVNMRKYLLMGAALSLLAAAPVAFANDYDGGDSTHHHDGQGKNRPTFDIFVAYASANNWAQSAGNRAWSAFQNTSASIANSGSGDTGILDQAQNAGANSVLQNALSLAYVNNPNRGYSSQTYGAGFSMAGAQNGAFVAGNNAETGFDNQGFWCPTVSQAASIYNSYNGGTGVVQVNQNVGDNSVLQNATAIADVRQVTGNNGTLGVSLASGSNNGGVFGNQAENRGYMSGSVNSSFNGHTGLVNLNQNAGANSLLQNSTSIGRVTLYRTSATTLAGTAALTDNDGAVFCNRSASMGGGNGVSMDSSVNGSTGIIQASQNAGSNSLIQNSVSVASVAP